MLFEHSMQHEEHAVTRRAPDDDEAIGKEAVRSVDAERVVEYLHGLEEGDAMLALVRRGFRLVPLEVAERTVVTPAR